MLTAMRFWGHLVAAACVAVSCAASAQSFDDVVEGRLLNGWRMEDGRHMAAIRLTLAPGWKTYWRVPGDAGIPPQFDWSRSVNVARVAVHWPIPSVFDQNGFTSVGYAGEVVMPLEVTPKGDGEIALGGDVQIGVCQDICIPVWLQVGGALRADASAGSEMIRSVLANQPMTASEAQVGAVSCQVEPISDGMRVTVALSMPPIAGDEAAVLEYSDPEIWVSEAQTERDGNQLVAVADLVPPNAQPFALSREGLRFTVLGEGRAVDIRGCTAPG